MKRKTIKYLLVSILTIAMVCSSNIAEAKSRRSSSRSSSSRSSSSSKSYSSSSSSTKTPTSTSSTNKNTANNKTNSSTTTNTNTSTSNTNTTNSVETNKNTTEIANKNSSLKVDSGTFTTKPDSITNNKSNSKNLNTSNNATSNNKTSSNNTSTSTSNYKYTVAPKEKTTSSSYTPSYYNSFDSNRYYSRNLGFFDYYMISHLINNNSNNRISERDIVYALEENGYTKDEIDNIMTDLEQEQKSKNNTNNTKKENALIESIPYIILGILIILILVSTLKR